MWDLTEDWQINPAQPRTRANMANFIIRFGVFYLPLNTANERCNSFSLPPASPNSPQRGIPLGELDSFSSGSVT
jgi:hypothetical protein